jgi:hypothetical protein
MADSIGSARQEAERLVATVFAKAAQSGLGGAGRGERSGTTGLGALADTVAGVVGQLTGGTGSHRGDPGKGWATGSAECCVCPVCRVIAGLREPSPHAVERLATGAGDFATGVASLMRAFSAMSGDRGRPARPARHTPPPPDHDTAAPQTTPDETASLWAAATRAPASPPTAPEARPTGEPEPITEAGPTGEAGRGTEAGPTGEARLGTEAGPTGEAGAGTEAGLTGEAGAGTEAGLTGEARLGTEAGPTGEAGAGTEAGLTGEARPDTQIGPTGEAGPTTAAGSEAGAEAKARPDAGMRGRPRAHAGKNDVWAAATADPGDPVVAAPPAVDHDGPGDGRNL